MAALAESFVILPRHIGFPSTNIGLLDFIKTKMLTAENKAGWERVSAPCPEIYAQVQEPPQAQAQVEEVLPAERISPRQKDTLFWCMFIAANGFNEYMKVRHNYGSRELETKKMISDYLVDNANKMKEVNVKTTKSMIQEIRSELITNINTTSMESLVAMAVYYGINVILLDETNKLRLEIRLDTEAAQTFLIYKDSYCKYSIRAESLSAADIEQIADSTVCLENHIKPIRQMGAYKLETLLELANKLGALPRPTDSSEKYKKQDVYTFVAEKMVWNLDLPRNRKLK